ncbi:MAG: TetM/TetW/TetO/TetS family tetracycline resistance ribosomal protection protein, partial [Lachnospiraceae bacterium]|nr:TetM/TetW/TetO/TetS family tetracycline resistance ribosomal protection protein [Lachnospiraceae bacterium]
MDTISSKITIGILAHVDAGKTTLSEALLFQTGALRKAGRVDHGNAFLDTHDLERQRGITIFSKPARFRYENREYTLLDTPGHADFSPETERALQILDYCIFLVSAPDGVTAQAKTLLKLLTSYRIPFLFFINKMDQSTANPEKLLHELKDLLGDGVMPAKSLLENPEKEETQEALAMLEESLLSQYLDGNPVERKQITALIRKQSLFPAVFGSALKGDGVDTLLDCLDAFCAPPDYPEKFSAKVYKITHENSLRLTWAKITGGALKIRDSLKGEKVDQIRVYSGAKYEARTEALAGEVCALAGLSNTYSGESLLFQDEPTTMQTSVREKQSTPLIRPIERVRVLLPEGEDVFKAYEALKLLEEEDPQLQLDFSPGTGAITMDIMGEIQMEVLKALALERFSMVLGFAAPEIIYKETIANEVIGMGHFEPLRHYAETHFLLSPGERGSGLTFDSICSRNMLPEHFQNLILSQMRERKLAGVLTGSEVTDVKISLLAGKYHLKHTEGGDFREASRRALRQGLMQAESILLEPILAFQLEVPERFMGRAMTDLSQREAKFGLPLQEKGRGILTGTIPAACLGDYARNVSAYTSGEGSLSLSYEGYAPCH